MDIVKRVGNDAINANPPNSQITITTAGSDWLWAVFAVMLLSALVMLGWAWSVPKGRRAFHYLAVMLLTTAAISYFTMASNLGGTPIYTEFGVSMTRSIWYVRYIDWVITTPFLLLELLLATGLPLADIVALLFFDEVMIITGLVGALVRSSYKWGYFTFGCAALFYIWWILLGPGLKSAGTLGPEFRKAYVASAIYLSVIWVGYPIAWGLADGSSKISANGEMYFYGALDLLAKPVFTFFHVFMLSKVDYTKMQLQSGKFSEGASLIGRPENELNNMHHKNRLADNNGVNPRASESTAVGHSV